MPKFVVGFDLNDQISQISYAQVNNSDLRSFAASGNEEKLGIPSVLCKRKEVNQWYFGVDAKTVSKRGEGTLVGKLISFARSGAKLEIEGEAYDPVDLLILFVKRSLGHIDNMVTPENVDCLIITVEVLDKKMRGILDRICESLTIDKDKILYQTYDESIYYYIIHQPEDIWSNSTMLFDYSNEFLKIYETKFNKGTKPIVGFVERKDYKNIKLPKYMMFSELSEEKAQRLDELFLQTVHDYFSGKTINTVFLIGEGFSDTWCDKTLKFLCQGRRVFQGKNLYSKGACFSAQDKVNKNAINNGRVIYLGNDKLKGNSGIYVQNGQRDEYVVLMDAGETYYSAKKEIDFILEKDKEINIVITPLSGGEKRIEKIELKGLPDRPVRATRLRLTAEFPSDKDMHVKVSDLGFGEFYLSSGKYWEKDIKLADE